MNKKLKPETVVRLAAKRRAEREVSKANLKARLAAKAAEAGPDSIWAEMLAELN